MDGITWYRAIKPYGKLVPVRRLLLTIIVSGILPGVLTAEQSGSDPAVLTLERIYDSDEFDPNHPTALRWLSDGHQYTLLQDANGPGGKDLMRGDPSTQVLTPIIRATELTVPGMKKPLSIHGYEFSPDRSKVLIYSNSKKVWRRNTRGDYWLFDLTDRSLKKLGPARRDASMMFCKFSPDGELVGYVRENDIYVQHLESMRIRRLTRSGSKRYINGTTDWVYEEEFRLRDGFRFSPDGRHIASWQFDTEGVGTFYLIDNTSDIYSEVTPLPYPKAGTTNSAVRIGVISVSGGPRDWVEFEGDPREHYLPRMEWVPDGSALLIQRMNRLQNENTLHRVEVSRRFLSRWPLAGKPAVLLVDRSAGWVNVCDDIEWIEANRTFTFTSERDGWRHLYRVSYPDGHMQCLTPGEYDVIKLLNVEIDSGWAYFMASPENPTQRYLYRIGLGAAAGRTTQAPERLSPTDQAGTHSYQLSDDVGYAVHTYSRFGKAAVTKLIRLPGHETVRRLDRNDPLQRRLDKLAPQQHEFFRVTIPERDDPNHSAVLDGYMLYPPQFDPHKQYPLLMHVYGEPAGQTVLDRTGGKHELFHRYLTQQGFLVASIDNRGTPAPRGRQWRQCVYGEVGVLSSYDQAEALKQMIAQRAYIDPDRVGVWGWSGGGSMSLNLIFRYPELYAAAVSVAPVTDQRYYDTIYQERYMGLPQDNKEGYLRGSPIHFAHQLEGDLLLIHGTADDNVHYQNTEALINKLIEHRKSFRMMSYPGRDHGIRGGEHTSIHLRTQIAEFLIEKLRPIATINTGN